MTMIEVKTSELSGAALDWAVKRGIGAVDEPGHIVQFPDWHPIPWMMGLYKPSAEWDHAGPLMHIYQIEFSICEETGSVGASLLGWRGYGKSHRTRWSKGKTHQIAACRAIVAARLGDTVSVPAELLVIQEG